MDTVLIVSEISFYVTVSVAVVALGILGGLTLYRLMQVLSELRGLFRKLNYASSEAGEWLTKSGDTLSEIPILSYFFKRRILNKPKKVKEKPDKTSL